MKRFFSSTVMVTWMSVSALSTGCTTVTVKEAIPLPEVPEYVKVPHPAGYDSADLKSFLLDPLAPKSVLGEFADTCDEEYTKLLNLNASKDELKKGAEELVTRTPERLHWCFYSKLGRLQDQVNGDAP